MEPLTLLFLGGKAIFESVNTAPRISDTVIKDMAVNAVRAAYKNVASDIVDAILKFEEDEDSDDSE